MASGPFAFLMRPPFKAEAEEEILFYQTLGRMSARFAMVEGLLDLVCFIAFHHFGKQRGEKAMMPRTFLGKVNFIRTNLSEDAPSALDRLTVHQLCDELKDAGEQRNEVMHSLMSEIDTSLNVKMLSIRAKEKSHTFTDVTQSIPKLEDFTTDLFHLQNQASHLVVIAALVASLKLGPECPPQLREILGHLYRSNSTDNAK